MEDYLEQHHLFSLNTEYNNENACAILCLTDAINVPTIQNDTPNDSVKSELDVITNIKPIGIGRFVELNQMKDDIARLKSDIAKLQGQVGWLTDFTANKK